MSIGATRPGCGHGPSLCRASPSGSADESLQVDGAGADNSSVSVRSLESDRVSPGGIARARRARPGRCSLGCTAALGAAGSGTAGAGQRPSRLALRPARGRRLALGRLGSSPALGGTGRPGLGWSGEQRSGGRLGTPPSPRRGGRRGPPPGAGVAQSVACRADRTRRCGGAACGGWLPRGSRPCCWRLRSPARTSGSTWPRASWWRPVCGATSPVHLLGRHSAVALGRRPALSDRTLHLRARSGRPVRPVRAGVGRTSVDRRRSDGGWPSSPAWCCARGASPGPLLRRGINPAEAVIAGVANPAVLLVFVAGIHNDALMISLDCGGRRPRAGQAPLVGPVSGRPGRHGEGAGGAGRARHRLVVLEGLVASPSRGSRWWARPHPRRVGGRRARLRGDGFSWLRSASQATVASSFSVLNLAGSTSSTLANAVQLGGIAVAVAIVAPAAATSELGRRARVGLRRDGGLRHQSAALVRLVGAPAAGLHGVRRPAPPRRHLRAVRHGGLERVALRQPRLVRRHRRAHVDPGPVGAPATGRSARPPGPARSPPTRPRSTRRSPLPDRPDRRSWRERPASGADAPYDRRHFDMGGT